MMFNRPLSIFNAPHTEHYRWSVDLYWYAQKKFCNIKIDETTLVAIVKRNKPYEQKQETLAWNIDIPHKLVEAYYDYDPSLNNDDINYYQLNIEYGILQILKDIPDEQVIELIECDMFHLAPTPLYYIDDDMIITDNIYEEWHLKSRTDNQYIVKPFIRGDIKFNGGFFPMILKAKTLKKIIYPWIKALVDLLHSDITGDERWWSGMYALQIACQNENVKMLNENLCYIPGINDIEGKRICHYSIGHEFNKRNFPNIDVSLFPDNAFYNTIKEWFAGFS